MRGFLQNLFFDLTGKPKEKMYKQRMHLIHSKVAQSVA